MTNTCVIIVPTFNGGILWEKCAEHLNKEITLFPQQIRKIIVIDSSSKDNTVNVAKSYGFDVIQIPSSDFNHGGTRNLCNSLIGEDIQIVCFLTQDALIREGAIKKLLNAFNDNKIALAFGRQIPHRGANPLAVHARYFNYKSSSYLVGSEQIGELGIKTVFTSNSFCAYEINIFRQLNGFPENTILCEDMYFSAKAILAGYKICYKADAEVEHSHNYTFSQELKRYFDIGVFHAKEKWIRDNFGGAGGEGKKFLISELKFLFHNGIPYIPKSFANNLAKIIGYKLGLHYEKLPNKLCIFLSMHKKYWIKKL